MMDNIDEKIQRIVKKELHPSESYKTVINSTLQSLENKNYSNNRFSMAIASACISAFLISGVAFAKEIEKIIKDKFYLGNGVKTAVDNGYIEEVKSDYVMSECKIINSDGNYIKNSNIGIKVDDFFIDNYNFSIDFNIKLNDNFINVNKINNIRLKNIIITDNENRIIYSETNKEKFKEFCDKNNLKYNYLEFNNKYLNAGLNNILENYNDSENIMNLIYNIYLENEEFPKLEKINIYFEKIEFETKDTNDNLNKLIALGNWNISIDIPQKMIDRDEIEYEVVSCENDNVDIYEAKATNTGFELGIIISNIEKPEYPKELEEQEKEIFKKFGTINKSNIMNETSNTEILATAQISFEDISEYYENSSFKSIYEDYYIKQYPIGNIRENYISWYPKTEGNYIINSTGDKFFTSNSVGGQAKYSFIDQNKFDYYTTFDMTKYNLTENITIVIELYGAPIKIEMKSR